MGFGELSTTSYALLGLLMFAGRTDERLTGYELKQRADLTLRYYWSAPAMSQVYSELAKLSAHGLVEGQTETGPRGATSYHITDAGQQVLRGWLADSPVEFPLLKHPVALRLLMGNVIAPETLRSMLQEYREALTERSADLQAVRDMLGDDERLRYPAMVADWGLAYFASEDRIVARLEGRLPGTPEPAPAPSPHEAGPRGPGGARLDALALDCPDPTALARFYAGVLGWTVVDGDPDWVEITDGRGRTLAFQLAPDHVAPTWPDPEVPQQAHLDIKVDDMDAAEAAALAAGARRTGHPIPEANGFRDSFRVYLDPAGHPFCFVRS